MGDFTRLADLLLTNDLDTALRLLDRQVTTSGGGGFLGLGLWRYRTETDSTPSSGQLQFDNTTIASATELYVHAVNDNGSDMSAFLDLLTEFDLMYIQVQADASQFVTLQIGTPSLTSSVYTFPILQIQGQGTTPSNNTEVAVVIEQSGIGSGVTDHGALSGLADDDHLQYLHKDITRNLTVGYTTDIEADTFTDPLVPDFSLEYFKTMTVTNDFTLDTPTGNGHGEYYLTVSGGPYTLTAGTNVTLIDGNDTLSASTDYILNIHRYSATNTLAQLLPVGSSWLDEDAIHDNIANEITPITDKPTPVSGDSFIIESLADGNAKRSVDWDNLEGSLDHYNLTNGGAAGSATTGNSWNAHGNVATGDATTPLEIQGAAFAITGSVGDVPTSVETATRVFTWIPSKRALRIGLYAGTENVLANMGNNSYGIGTRTEARAANSYAFGKDAIADTLAVNGIAFGDAAFCNARDSIALGAFSFAQASDPGEAMAIGRAIATGIRSASIGYQTETSADFALALGSFVKASATGAACLGVGDFAGSTQADNNIGGTWICAGQVDPVLALRTQRCGILEKNPLSTLDVGGSTGYTYTNLVSVGVPATDTILLADELVLYIDSSLGQYTIDLPVASTVDRRVYYIKCINGAGGNNVNIVPNAGAGDVIDNAAGGGGTAANRTIVSPATLHINCDGANGIWWVL